VAGGSWLAPGDGHKMARRNMAKSAEIFCFFVMAWRDPVAFGDAR
jgi:hypothetical protein